MKQDLLQNLCMLIYELSWSESSERPVFTKTWQMGWGEPYEFMGESKAGASYALMELLMSTYGENEAREILDKTLQELGYPKDKIDNLICEWFCMA